MDEQKFAIVVADKYRQTFDFDFCQDGNSFLWNGNQPKKFISEENLIRTLSCADAVLTALEFLAISNHYYQPQHAIVLLFLYKQIIFRTDRKRLHCQTQAELEKIGQEHIADLAALKQFIHETKRSSEILPTNLDWLASALWFFQQDKPFNFNKAITSAVAT